MTKRQPSEDAPLDGVPTELETERFLASVDRGLRQADQGQLIPHEEIVGRLQERFRT